MTRKDYVTIAAACLDLKQRMDEHTHREMVQTLCTYLKQDNGNFNNYKFKQAAGVKDDR